MSCGAMLFGLVSRHYLPTSIAKLEEQAMPTTLGATSLPCPVHWRS